MGHSRRDGGYTLLELMVIVSILGILVLVAVASYQFSVDRSYRVTCRSNQRVFGKAVLAYVSAHDDYPTAITDLEAFVHGYGAAAKCPKDGRPLAYDAARHDITCTNHPAW